ncbi:MAG TPA: carboxypeptidase-like regulatory domain-containing protein, partial [Gemmatimonadaceae bacterium]|nr:carboxypeptidase-like regulatory domain-containing protein [Gemmatimonadaceae bacterium]
EVRAKACLNGGPVSGGSSILVGRVVKADNNEPAAGASVSLLFKDLSKTPPVEKVRSGRVGPTGAFAICGLPSTLSGNLQATLGGVTTADVPIKSNDESMSTVMLSIGGTGSGSSVLKGVVKARGGGPIAGAQVTVVGTTSVVMSADDGSFTLSGLPSGTHEAVVRKIGFAKVSQIVELKAAAPGDVTVLLEPATVLGTIHVVGVMENGLNKVGFLQRKQHGAGIYLTPEQIAEKNPNMTTDLMRSMNGMRVINANNGRYLTSTSTVGSTSEGCINLFIDHARFDQFQPGDVDDAIPTGDLGAIEYYGTPTLVPAEFSIPGKQCATLVVWTKTLLTTLKP